MNQVAAAVLAPQHTGTQAAFGDGQENVNRSVASFRKLLCVHRNLNCARLFRIISQGDREMSFWFVRRFRDRISRGLHIAPYKLILTVDDHLRSINTVSSEAPRVCGLAGAELCAGEGIFPSKV